MFEEREDFGFQFGPFGLGMGRTGRNLPLHAHRHVPRPSRPSGFGCQKGRGQSAVAQARLAGNRVARATGEEIPVE